MDTMPTSAPPLAREVASMLSHRDLRREDLEALVEARGFRRIEDIHEELMFVTFYYISNALMDHLVTEEELTNTRFLKLLFKLKEGELYEFFPDVVKLIVDKQLSLVYEDGEVSKDESLHMANIQTLFDLSYEQMDDLKLAFVKKAIEQGSDIEKLDTAHKDLMKE